MSDGLPVANESPTLDLATLERRQILSAAATGISLNEPAPAVDRIVRRLARAPCKVRMNNAPDVCRARDRQTGETGRRFGWLDGVISPRRFLAGTSISRSVVLGSTSLPAGERKRTFFKGDDCSGDTVEEKECFLFLLGVQSKSSGNPSCELLALPAFNVLVNAGPRRFTAGEFSVRKA